MLSHHLLYLILTHIQNWTPISLLTQWIAIYRYLIYSFLWYALIHTFGCMMALRLISTSGFIAPKTVNIKRIVFLKVVIYNTFYDFPSWLLQFSSRLLQLTLLRSSRILTPPSPTHIKCTNASSLPNFFSSPLTSLAQNWTTYSIQNGFYYPQTITQFYTFLPLSSPQYSTHSIHTLLKLSLSGSS